MQATRGYFVEVGKSLRLKLISIRLTIGKQHATGFIIGSRKARFLGMNHLVGDQRGLKFMVIPQPSLSEKVINRAASPTHRSEEHTSELQSLMRISYAVFCLKKKTNMNQQLHKTIHIHKI